MLNLLLGPVGRLVLVLFALASAGGVGFWKGAEWQQGKRAKAEVQVLTKQVEVVRKVQVGQEQVAAAYEKGRADREEEFRKLQAEFDQQLRAVLATAPSVCTWNDDVVGLINRARSAGRGAQPSSFGSGVPQLRWEVSLGEL